jgi:putative hydrolase of the HAD superfamily
VGGVVLWDFDGTLAWRPGLWGGCVLEVLDELAPGHTAELEKVRAVLKGGFPWDRHTEPHPHLSSPDAWWETVTPLLSRAIRGCVEEARVPELAHAVRLRFIDASKQWRVFDDTRSALGTTASTGWRNVVLSNHVPELSTLVAQLGLGDLVERVFSSATTGYEKPHPEAFRVALRACGNPARRWMVGDNPIADVAGAEALGIPAILVRTNGRARQTAKDVAAAAKLIVRTFAGDTGGTRDPAQATLLSKEET